MPIGSCLAELERCRSEPDRTLPQVACFDTSFHHTQPEVAAAFALPRRLTDDGVRRYGFHGLSYEYIASVLPEIVGSTGVFDANTESEINAAFASLEQRRPDAVLVISGALFLVHAKLIASLAGRYRVPAIYARREFAETGGLMSYGYDVADGYRLLGVYAGRILRGEKAGDLPVFQPTKFELVINLKTAKALGFEIPANWNAATHRRLPLRVKNGCEQAAAIPGLFDHLVGEHQNRARHGEAQRFSGLEVDDHLVFHRKLHREIAWLRAA
jgi:hypothetical protein